MIVLDKNIIEEIQYRYIHGEEKQLISKELGVSKTTVGKYTKGLFQKYDNMTGKKFGRLLVLERVEKEASYASRCHRYLCRCECGETIVVNGNSLRSGHTTSCGCSRKLSRIVDLTGQKFGKLTVIKLAEEKIQNDRALWVCQCECGNIIKIDSHQLKKRVSCGCVKTSHGEELVEKLLVSIGADYKRQYKFEDCKNKRVLPFDYAVFDAGQLICLIEFQGDIHYTVTGGWNTEERFNEQQKRDKIKREYCQNNNIKLIEIPYWDIDILNEEYLKGKIYD